MPDEPVYDTIGVTYSGARRTDPRIAAEIWAALGDAESVVNVGAGTGSYEPTDRKVLAVEPSAVMRAQRPRGAAPCINGTAELLPLDDNSVDAAMAVATVHHWRDPLAGLREMRRVARRVVVLTFDADVLGQFWLTRDYLPEVLTDPAVALPSLPEKARAIDAEIHPVLIPWDCVDGFFEAYWRRPEAYMDESVRRGTSAWARLSPGVEQRVVASLRDDLMSGVWAERNHHLLSLEAADVGLRLLIA